MKNDFQILPLANLANTYNTILTQELEAARNLRIAVALRAWQQQHRALMKELELTSEAGSDGLEEAISETLGPFQPPQLPLEEARKITDRARTQTLADFAAKEDLPQKLTWLPLQMMAYFGNWQAVKCGDLYSPKATFEHNVIARQDRHGLGAVLLAKADRSLFFKGAPKGFQQYKSAINPLVPIVLAGFKRYQNIPYMAWDLSELSVFTDSAITDLVGCKTVQLTAEDFHALRNLALTVKTGAKAGTTRSPSTTATLVGLETTPLGSLPRLARHITLQTWCAHPLNRDKYAILDLEDWDRVPSPIAGGTLFQPEPQHSSYTAPTEISWLT